MLKVINLTKKFKDFTAVDDISFEAKDGEIFGLLGPNGAGKTTTIRVIATVLQATSGTAEVGGFDIKDQAEQVRANLGLLTTDIGLYDRFTARENLRYYGELYGLSGVVLENRISELIEMLNMRSFADRRAGKFSTGMKQKVAIARSVIHDPKVIIFDEPTSGLDVLASRTVVEFMKKAKEMGKLVVLSTHEMFNAEKLCDRVAIMHKGMILAVDAIENIKNKTGGKDLEEAFVKLVGEETDYEPERKSDFAKASSDKKNLLKKYFGKRFSLGRIILAVIIIAAYYLIRYLIK
ncbi:MAG: ATP-binding cassette domain-containing protein [Patescibacteria group bacterium]